MKKAILELGKSQGKPSVDRRCNILFDNKLPLLDFGQSLDKCRARYITVALATTHVPIGEYHAEYRFYRLRRHCPPSC